MQARKDRSEGSNALSASSGSAQNDLMLSDGEQALAKLASSSPSSASC